MHLLPELPPRTPPLPTRWTINIAKWWAVAAAIVTGGAVLVFPAFDRIDIIIFSPTTNEKAVLIDGKRDGTFQNDWSPGTVPAATNSIRIGDFRNPASPNSGEVVAFSAGKFPFIQAPTTWSYFTDTVHVEFHDAYDLTVKVWLLTDANVTYSKQWLIKNLHCNTAVSIWKGEGHGLHINCDVQDGSNANLTLTSPTVVTGPARSLFSVIPFDCDSTHPGDLQSTPSLYQADVLNVYYIDSVITNTGESNRHGIHCNGATPANVIAIAAYAHQSVLAHELGHAFIGNGIEDHVDDLSPRLQDQCSTMPATQCAGPPPETAGDTPSLFDRTNVMHGASSLRATLTEGQVFRASFNASSVLNDSSLYQLNMGRRTCGGVGIGTHVPPPHTSDCPQLEKRLWPDHGGEFGTWPAN